MIAKTNYFILLINRPWPLLSSFRIINFLIRILIFLKNNERFTIILSLIILRITTLFWFLDFNTEINTIGMESINLESSIKLFFILFILSEVIVFLSLFWSNYWFFLVPEFNPIIFSNIVKFFDYRTMPIINTFILLMSSVTITISHQIYIERKTNLKINFLISTVILGIIFTFLQAIEYINSYFNINDSCYGSIFFILTGLHGTHVILGSMILFTCYLKFIFINNIIYKSERFEMGAWYWHFVDLIWLFVIYSLYFLHN